MEGRWLDLDLDTVLGADLDAEEEKNPEKSKMSKMSIKKLFFLKHLLITREHFGTIWKHSGAPKHVFRGHRCDEVPSGNPGSLGWPTTEHITRWAAISRDPG